MVIRTVIWSTGYRQDFSWIRVPGVLAETALPTTPGRLTLPALTSSACTDWEAGSGTLLGCGMGGDERGKNHPQVRMTCRCAVSV